MDCYMYLREVFTAMEEENEDAHQFFDLSHSFIQSPQSD
jgi:hypothetical protein